MAVVKLAKFTVRRMPCVKEKFLTDLPQYHGGVLTCTTSGILVLLANEKAPWGVPVLPHQRNTCSSPKKKHLRVSGPKLFYLTK